jgi:plastocyanin domain-containing protein
MKTIIASLVVGAFLVGGAVMLSQNNTRDNHQTPEKEEVKKSNVTIEDGKQIVTVSAKGGYLPEVTEAKADMPTVLRVETKNTFDCSAVLALPSMDYQKNLPPTGITEVELPPQEAGSTFEGLCGMGMYRFEIAFK